MTDTPTDLRLAYRPREAAAALGISERTLWAQTSPRGGIPCVRVGAGKRQSVLYPVHLLEKWLTAEAQIQESEGRT